MLEPGAEMEKTDNLAPDSTNGREILYKEAGPPPEYPFCILTTSLKKVCF